MAERCLGTLRHIVFILKTCMLNVANWFVSCSGIFAARTPARRASRLRECYGLPTVNRYHGTLTPPRNAPSRPRQSGNGSIIIPNFSIMAISRHHMSVETASLLSLSSSLRSPVTGFWAEKTSSMQATHSHRRLFETSGHSVKLANGVFVISVNCGSL